MKVYLMIYKLFQFNELKNYLKFFFKLEFIIFDFILIEDF